MGFRFRKSIPIGKHFRINLSKSGVGYSYGVKGARFTKTANGKNRTTLSVPGTGISYTTESKAHTSKKKPTKKKTVTRKAATAKQQIPRTSQTSGAQSMPSDSIPPKGSFDIASFKAAHPVWFWIIAISIWPISLSIWFLKTENIKKLNKTARICLLIAFWVIFFFIIGGIAGTQGPSIDDHLSDPISKITSRPSPTPTATPEPTPTPTPTPEPTSTPAPATAKQPASQSQTQQGTQNNAAGSGGASGSGGQTASQPANEASYVLNTSTHKFHRPGCGEVNKIHAENRKDVSGNRNDIINQGYTPCKKCNP